MVDRIKAALDARTDPHFLLIARTDARATHDLAEAIERGRMCAEIGADVIFIEAPESSQQVEEIGRAFRDVPLLINRVAGGKTPPLSVAELEKMGYGIVIFPGDLQRAAGKTMIDLLKFLQTTGSTEKAGDAMMAFEERFEVLGLSRYRELESRYINEEEKSPPK
jgi:2-methylisocitrate lyase-like PEP mutase family enzyme